MKLSKLSEELNNLIDMIDNNFCYVVTSYKPFNDSYKVIDSIKFNTFNEAYNYKDSVKDDVLVTISKTSSLEETMENQKSLIFKLTMNETGYYLTSDDNIYQIYPENKQKFSVTEAIKNFVEDELIYEYDSIISSSVKWLDFSDYDCTGTVEIILYK